MRHFPLLLLLGCLGAAADARAQGWELARDIGSKDRPPVVDGVVTVEIGKDPAVFPRYFNELDISAIRIEFEDEGGARREVSFVWTGGSEGKDRFEATLDGTKLGMSREVDSPARPGAFYLDKLDGKLGPGKRHVLELRSPEENRSAIQFSGIRLAKPGAAKFMPLCYESVGTLAGYEEKLGAKGVRCDEAHLTVFAPATHAKGAHELAQALEKAYGVMAEIHGEDMVFRFSIENYPEGNERGYGGIWGAATIGYRMEALERFEKLKWTEVRGVIGYTEEMCHGFKDLFRCNGTYEALGVAVQEEVLRRLFSAKEADAYYKPIYDLWNTTYRDWRAAGNRNPDPEKYPWGVLYTRLLNKLFMDLRNAYGAKLWPDFFAELRRRNYPLFAAKPPERLGIYADVFTALFKKDMRKHFTEFGIELDKDPPWGSDTYKK